MSAVRRRSRQRGFTIVELLVTIVIVGILAAAAFPMAELVVRRGKERELQRDLNMMRDAIDSYKHAYDEGRIEHTLGASGYPPTLAALVEGVVDQRSPERRRIFFLRRIPRDPFASDLDVPAERTWQTRSYASTAAEPKPGADVYDVSSAHAGVGMNGVPYAQW